MSTTTPSSNGRAVVDRRGFVGAASAALVAANGAAALAQAEALGKPHPPLVAEDDPAIAVARPRLTPTTGSPIDGYAARPRTVTPTTPGVVVVQHVWGVDAQIRDVVRRYAKAGFVAIAPNLYGRLGWGFVETPTAFDDQIRGLATRMYAAGDVPTDLLAGEAWIRTVAANGNVGITGFCMGGGITLQSVIDSRAFAAASMFYGDVRPGTKRDTPTTPATFAFTSRIATPLMGSFGALDTSIRPEDVEAMFSRLTAPHDLRIYAGAGHAFFDDTRSSYRADAAADAWARTLTWFGKYLG